MIQPCSPRSSTGTPLHSTLLHSALLSVVLTLVAAAAPMKFDIPAQPAPSALKLFTHQSGKQAIFIQDDLKDVTVNEVKGEMEPVAALQHLLQKTGFEARQTSDDNFVVGREKPFARTARIEGSIRDDSGRGVVGAVVSVRGSDRTALTDRRGGFIIEDAPVGTQILLVTAEGMQNTRVTDVSVKEGRTYTLSPITIPARNPGVVKMEDYVVSAKKNDGVVELDPYEVSGERARPFSDSNVDLPRTIDDPQAYYIFNSKTIEQSGVSNLEEFLQERLTMVSTPATNAQQAAFTTPFAQRTTSSIRMRGLSAPQTLILVNGRRIPQIAQQGSEFQGDINGIPLAAVERVEVLPSSASAIYGGGAIAGVINIITKRSYTGGEVRLTYDNAFDTDSPRRRADLTYGFTLEGGKTSVMLSTSYADTGVMLTQDRAEIFATNWARYLRNNPNQFATASSLFIGTTPNVFSSAAGVNLTLKDGTPLGSPMTFLPPGYVGYPAGGTAALVANAGKLNTALPETTNPYSGLRQRVGSSSETKSFSASVRRQMTSWLDVSVDYSYSSNSGGAPYNGFSYIPLTTVPANAPGNPFQQAVRVTWPDAPTWDANSKGITRSLVSGFVMKLPHGWRAQGDYTWNRARSDSLSYSNAGNPALNTAVTSGAVNVLRDSFLYPNDFSPYTSQSIYIGPSSVNETSLRAAGPLIRLPWGSPSLAVGLQRRKEGKDDVSLMSIYPTPESGTNTHTIFPGQAQSIHGGYAELQVPVISKDNAFWGARQLDLQLAGRHDVYTVGLTRTTTGTSYNKLLVTPAFFHKTTEYKTIDPTFGVRYKPFNDVALRVSYASAFIPPTYSQLLPGIPSANPTNVNDPRRGGVSVGVIADPVGGNPELTPEESESINWGVILTPRQIPGLRLSVDYSYIKKENNIGSLTAQLIVNNEALFPGRVVRGPVPAGDTFGVGPIIGLDTRMLNLYQASTESYEMTANYRKVTDTMGTFTFNGMGTVQTHYRQRLTLGSPLIDYAGFYSQGAIHLKSNASLNWEYRRWLTGWTTRYYSSYKQSGPPVNTVLTTIQAQGSTTIPAQIFHDMFVQYRFPTTSSASPWWARALSRTDVTVGVKNVFRTLPEFDANYAATMYASPAIGDFRLRTYSLSVKRAF